jgi:hypothetical protein
MAQPAVLTARMPSLMMLLTAAVATGSDTEWSDAVQGRVQ